MNFLLRIFSFLFLLPVTLFVLGIGLFALLAGAYDLNLPMLPWSGAALTYWISGLSLVGLLSIILAIRKKVRGLYAAYALVVFLLAVYGTFFSSYRFDGMGSFQWTLAFCAGALTAAAGAFLHAKQRT